MLSAAGGTVGSDAGVFEASITGGTGASECAALVSGLATR
jgi:hypothetical protein